MASHRTRIPRPLKPLLKEAIRAARRRYGRREPSKEDVLDELFSSARGDPEAVYLSHKLDRMIEELLGR